MSVSRHIVVGVHITDRVGHAGEVQQVFTKYGCSIKTRIGLHEADKHFCSPNGLIILEMIDDKTQSDALTRDLRAVAGVEVQEMVFDHP